MTLEPTIEQLQEIFYPSPVPVMLEDLLTFQMESIHWYSLGFEVALLSQKDLAEHIVEDAITQFFAFGHDGNYSLYALWRYKEMSLEDAPVVYLNSEAEGSRVLANNFSAFLTLLACDEEPIFGQYSDIPDEEKQHSPRNQEFREWLENCYHLHFAQKPNEVVHDAERKHPMLPLACQNIFNGLITEH